MGEHFGKEIACCLFKSDRGPDGDVAVWVIDRVEEGKSCEMVPVGMADQNVNVFGAVFFKRCSKRADSGAGIDDDHVVAIPNF